MAFTIRDIYLNTETDHGQNYSGALAELEKENKITLVDKVKYTKYKGLQYGDGYKEEQASVMVYRKV